MGRQMSCSTAVKHDHCSYSTWVLSLSPTLTTCWFVILGTFLFQPKFLLLMAQASNRDYLLGVWGSNKLTDTKDLVLSSELQYNSITCYVSIILIEKVFRCPMSHFQLAYLYIRSLLTRRFQHSC